MEFKRTRLDERLKNACEGQNIFLIGNGPSLSLHSLEQYSRAGQLFTCNGFASCKKITNISPLLYFLGDPIFRDEKEARLSKFGPKIIEDLVNKYPYTTLFTSDGVADGLISWASRLFDENEGTLHILESNFRGGAIVGGFDLQLEKGIQDYQNILVLMLQVALYLKPKNIYLDGFDFSTILTYPTKKMVAHFYDSDKSISWRDQKDPRGASQLEFFRSCFFTLSQIESIREIATKLGINIINLSGASMLEAFTKQRWTSI